MNQDKILDWRYSTKNFNPNKSLNSNEVSQLLEALRMSPSAGNTQPWHFVVAQDLEGRKKIAKAANNRFPEMNQRILDSSLAIVACSLQNMEDSYLKKLLEEEDKAGRYVDEAQMMDLDRARRKSVQIHREILKDIPEWTSRQLYIAIGFFLMTAAEMEIDSLVFESIDWNIIKEEFELDEKGLNPHLILLAGHRDENDYNAPSKRPKYRWPESEIFTKV